MAASFLDAEEFAITEDEAKTLSKAVTRVTELYEISVLPEKTIAWINLAMVGSGIYGPRYMAMNRRKSAKAKPQLVKTQQGGLPA